MIVLLDTPQPLDECARELGGVPVEQLLTPLTRYTPQRPEGHFAIDNGAYSTFRADYFRSLLRRNIARRHLCRFVTAPDVVGSARRTLDCFEKWRRELRAWPLAFVCQNGQENLPIPWEYCDAIFLGGDTEWKMGPHAVACIKAALALGKWVHAGRVNTPGRYERFKGLGVHSIDGTGLSRYSHMREKIYAAAIEPRFDFTAP